MRRDWENLTTPRAAALRILLSDFVFFFPVDTLITSASQLDSNLQPLIYLFIYFKRLKCRGTNSLFISGGT